MATFIISENVRKKALRSSWLILGLGILIAALAGWLLFGGNVYSLISGVLGACLGVFVIYAAVKTIGTIKHSQPVITIDDDGIEISGEKDPTANRKVFWSQVKSAKVIHLSTAPYLELFEKGKEKITAGYRFNDFDIMVSLVKDNLERFGISLEEEIALPPEG